MQKVLRNSMGTWISNFAINVGVCSSLRKELRAMIYELEIVWSLYIRRLILKSDSEVTIKLIQKK